MSSGGHKRRDARSNKYLTIAPSAKPKVTKHGKPPEKPERTERWQ